MFLFFFLGSNTISKLKKLKNSTKLLLESITKLDSLYNVSLLVILTSLSLNTMFEMYFSIFGGFTKNSNKTSVNFQRISNIANNAVSSLYYFVRFYFVCFVANRVSNKVKNIQP